MQQNFRRLLILGLVGALAVAAFGATALAVKIKNPCALSKTALLRSALSALCVSTRILKCVMWLSVSENPQSAGCPSGHRKTIKRGL